MEKDLKTEEFIKKSIEIHGDKYDYSEVYYESSKKKIIIICKIHGKFEKRASAHIGTQKHGCKKCSIESRLLTLDFFLEKSKEVHGDKYDYSLVEYVNTNTKVKIICKEHGMFEQLSYSHLAGSGCAKCSGKNKTIDDFIKKAKEVHADKFDYSLVTEYKPNREKMTVICKKHGAFGVTYDHHINRCQGCPKCKSLNLDGFIEKANKVHDNKYDYSKVIYTNNRAKVDIICPIHGLFNQRVSEHINKKSGCLECSLEAVRMSVDDFIYKANKKHDNKYVYDKDLINFKNNKEKVSIFCPNHGVFIQKVNSHLCGSGCPSCKESKGERFISNYLKKEKIKFKKQYKFDDCRNILPLPFDFYLLEYNMCIEFNGKQHYEPIEMFGGEKMFISQQKRDEIKKEYCKQNNIPLIIIKYDEDIEKILNESIF